MTAYATCPVCERSMRRGPKTMRRHFEDVAWLQGIINRHSQYLVDHPDFERSIYGRLTR